MKNKTKSALLRYGSFVPLSLLALALSSAKGINHSNKFSSFDVVQTNVKALFTQDLQTTDSIYAKVDTLPSFPEGLSAFGRFLGKNLKYPPVARDAEIQGRVFLNFIVEKDGTLSNIKVVRGIGGGCDEEALRVMKLSPKWNPGIKNNKKVRVSYTIPVFFQLAGIRKPHSKNNQE